MANQAKKLRVRKNSPFHLYVILAIMAAIVVFVAVYYQIHPVRFDKLVDLSADKLEIDQDFSKIPLPATLHRVSNNYQIKSFPADSSSIYSFPEKVPWWEYEYAVSGAPNNSKALADSISHTLTAAGYTLAEHMYDRPTIQASRPSPRRASYQEVVEVEFNHIPETQDYPLSNDYVVHSVTFISYEE